MDEAPPEEDEQDNLKWRDDPSETHSDWKIEIVSKPNVDDSGMKEDNLEDLDENGNVVESYHVHKYALAHGKRRSEYFVKLFRNGGSYNESETHISRIELDPLAAKAFPCLLDYVYEPDAPVKITTASATALYYLAEYFEMRHLRWDAKEFCKLNLSLENAHIYCDHATLFHSNAFLHLISKFLGEHIMKVETSSPVLRSSNLDLWEMVLEYVCNISDRNVSIHVSKLITELVLYQEGDLDKRTFCALTNEGKMPSVHPHVAMALCELEDVVVAYEDAASDTEGGEEGCMHSSKLNGESLSSLQERCASSLAETWLSLKALDETKILMLEERKPSFLVNLLMKSLHHAATGYEDSRNKLDELNAVLNKTVDELERTKAQMKLPKAQPVDTDDKLKLRCTKVETEMSEPDTDEENTVLDEMSDTTHQSGLWCHCSKVFNCVTMVIVLYFLMCAKAWQGAPPPILV